MMIAQQEYSSIMCACVYSPEDIEMNVRGRVC